MANTLEEKIKAYLTPMLISAFGMVSWSVISEIRADVKVLLNAKAETTIRVDNLERRMSAVELVLSDKVFAIKPDDEIKVQDEEH